MRLEMLRVRLEILRTPTPCQHRRLWIDLWARSATIIWVFA